MALSPGIGVGTPFGGAHPGAVLLSRALVAFDERRADPTVNLGTLGPAGDVVYAGTVKPDPATPHIRTPGTAGNTLTCTAPASATQFRATPVSGSDTTGAANGGATFTFSTAGNWVRVQLLNASNVVVAELLPPADEGALSFLDSYGVTWAINRATGTGYKTEIIRVGSRLFNGTSDFGEVPNLPGLNFGASDPFTVFALVRRYDTASTRTLVAKKAGRSAGAAGYNLYGQNVTWFQIADGAVVGNANDAFNVNALELHAGIRDVATDQIRTNVAAPAGTSVTDTTTASLANSHALRFGRLSDVGTEYFVGRMYAWGLSPWALTDAQLAALRQYLISGWPP